jgi:hypothetical protein
MDLGLDNANVEIAAQQATVKNMTQEVEKVEYHDMHKDGTEIVDPAEEKRLIRKLDLWYGNCCNRSQIRD